MAVATTIACVTDATCTPFRDSISARIDGELDDLDEMRLDAHLATCRSCTTFQDDAFALRRALRMQAVPAPPTSTTTPAELGIIGSLRGLNLLRVALFVIGGTLVIINLQAIVTAGDSVNAHLRALLWALACWRLPSSRSGRLAWFRSRWRLPYS